MATDRVSILGGPSRFELLIEHFVVGSRTNNPIAFTIEMSGGHYKLEMYINALEREDSSGESWLFRGFIPSGNWSYSKAEGYFSTKTRKGWLVLKD